jgi:hypothetical protein
MEVHTHTHTPHQPAGKAGKKWIHYFWEFLMLFLAVFCGFLAENQREHYVEKKREHQYIRSLIKDIEMQTFQIDTIVRSYQNKLPHIDSLLYYFPELLKGKTSDFLRNYPVLIEFIDFYYIDRTMQQLKNAGGLRLISNPAVSDSIVNYDVLIRDFLAEQEHITEDYWKEIWIAQKKIFDYFRIDSLEKVNQQINIENKKAGLLLTNDRQELVGFYSLLKDLKINIKYELLAMQDLKKTGFRLITFLKQEYHME